MKIDYYKKNVYGRDYAYVKEKSMAEAIERLTGKKTIDERDMISLAILGCEFNQVLP